MKAMKLMPFALMVGANLESVVMVLIKMKRLGLIGANLAGANMQHAILFVAKLHNADVTIVNLIETNLEVSELMSADLPLPTLRASVSWVSTSPAQRLATPTNAVLIRRVRKALGRPSRCQHESTRFHGAGLPMRRFPAWSSFRPNSAKPPWRTV